MVKRANKFQTIKAGKELVICMDHVIGYIESYYPDYIVLILASGAETQKIKKTPSTMELLKNNFRVRGL